MVLTEDNYYSPEANLEYMSESQFKQFAGTYGRRGCEYRALKMLTGRWNEKVTDAMLIGSYVDAYVDGPEQLQRFQQSHPLMFKSDGMLYAKYRIAEIIIDRIQRDEFFMDALGGEHQVIMTGELFGAKWKIKMDAYHPHKAIVDLKTVQRVHDPDDPTHLATEYVRDLGRLDWVRYWDYTLQGAVYQEIVRQNTGERLPFYLAAVSKEEFPDIDVIRINQKELDDAMAKVEINMPRINALRNGEELPYRCEGCDCCRQSKVLKTFTDFEVAV